MMAIQILTFFMFFISLGVTLFFIVDLVSFSKIIKRDEPTKHENKLKILTTSIVFISLFWTVFFILTNNLF